ncbi:MAG: hypothetical protein IJZ51_00665 [Ruminiclostridium sp.]|nr:hypothetical protein [Ruminiclostridium sp.]
MKMKKILSIILTAAIILTTACSDNNTSSVNAQNSNVSKTESNTTSSTDSSSETSQNIVTEAPAENTPNRVDDTLPQCEPANKCIMCYQDGSIMKSVDGYYYSTSYTTFNGEFTGNYVLSYYDVKSGKSIPLCSKPECMHDGNQFCVATSHIREVSFGESWDALYNGYIYRLAQLNNEMDESGGSTREYVLYRSDLQGNERSFIAKLYDPIIKNGDGTITFLSDAIFHLGKLFYTMNGDSETVGELYVLDLESGKRKQIIIPENKDGIERTDNDIFSITADGDYLYFAVMDEKKKGDDVIYDKTTLYRYNIKSGEIITVSALPDIYSSFTVNNGIVYYITVDRANNTFSLYSYDIENDKTTALEENVQQGYLEGKHISESNRVKVYTDRQYLYISTCGDYQYKRENSHQYETDFYVYSLDGKKLLHGLKGLPTDIPEWSFIFRALDGHIYLDFDSYTPKGETDNLSGVYTIKTEELINGSTEWTKLYNSGR